jgi:tetratricopeptide (TPR) repeat protein
VARLEDAGAPEARDAIKSEIIALFKQVEQEIAQMSALRDDVKKLVERWKRLQQASAPSNAPEFASERPVVADHIGASTFIEKGWSLISLGDHEGAERALLKALELSPNDPQTESLLGWAQMLQEKYDEALLNFQKVLMRQPTNSLARINLGYICLKKKIFGEAIEHLSKAIRLDNDRKATLYAHFYLGLTYAEREMYEDAQTFFRKTLSIGPNLIEAYYELGRALWFDGKQDDAKQAWRDGLAANKFNPWGKRCGEMLKHVEDGGVPSRSS